MWASSGIVLKRGVSRSRSALADFITNRRGGSGLLSDPTAIAASPSSSGPFLYSNRRGQAHHFSNFADANGKRPFLIDTSDLVKMMEAQEVPRKQAEVIAEVLKDGLGSVTQSFPWKGGMEKDQFWSLVQRETERLCSDNEKKHIAFGCELGVANEKLRGDAEQMASDLLGDILKLVSEFHVDNEKMSSDIRAGNEKMRCEYRIELETVTSHTWNMHSELRAELHKMTSDIGKENGEMRVLLEDATCTARKYFISILVLVAVVALAACFLGYSYYDVYIRRVEAGKGMERRE